MGNDRPYWNMEMEPLLNTPEMEKIQLQKLKKMLSRLKANAPFYTRILENAKLDPDKLSGFDEFKDKISLFNKQSLLALVQEYKGDLLKVLDQIMPVSVDELDYMATTTGTTGTPTPYPLTNFDINELWGEAMVRGAWRAGLRSNDRMLFCFALSMVIAGVTLMIGLQKLGCMTIPVGAEAKSERILLMQKLFRGTFYVGTPSLAEYLIETNRSLEGVVGVVTGGEVLFDEQREILERAFRCPVYNRYGSREFANVAHECPEHSGLHVFDDLYYVEVLDDSGRAVEPGVVGQLVVTDLFNRVMPFIRYRTGDLVSWKEGKCECGRSYRMFSRVEGRSFDVIVTPSGKKVGGYFWTWLSRAVDGIGAFQVVQKEVDGVVLRIVPGQGWNEEGRKDVIDQIRKVCGDGFEVRIEEVTEIPLTPSGKRRFILSDVSR